MSLVNPDDPSFMLPPSMPEAIAAFCRKTGQLIPEGLPGLIVRCPGEFGRLAPLRWNDWRS
ncbi:MAG: hypothetical protein U0793_12805 [Gemmataceae bacterium]